MSTTIAPPRSKRMDVYSATTNASGNAVFTFTPAFSRLDFVSVELVDPASTRVSYQKSSESVSGVTVRAMAPAVVSVIGIDVLGAPVAVNGQQIKVMAVGF